MTQWSERIRPEKLADRTALDHDMYGVEVEVEFNAPNDSNIPKLVQNFWSVVNDGSLRSYGKSGDCAAEFRFTKPLNSFTSAIAVKQLCSVLNTETKHIYDSGRTSTHVHVNVCNINMLQIMNLITLSIIFDEFLVAQHHPFRSGNLFALRYVDAEWPVRMLLHEAQRPNFRKWSSPQQRYASVNLASIANFGTIEFRAMDGEINPQRINQWVFCLHQLKRGAMEYKNPREIIEKFNKVGPLSFLNDHIPSYYILNTSPPLAVEMLTRGVTLAADLAYATDWISSDNLTKKAYDEMAMYGNINLPNSLGDVLAQVINHQPSTGPSNSNPAILSIINEDIFIDLGEDDDE